MHEDVNLFHCLVTGHPMPYYSPFESTPVNSF
jgi:hypothetical protein